MLCSDVAGITRAKLPSNGGSIASRRGRGRYDRTASASERARAQRGSLLAAVRQQALLDEGEVTVGRLLAIVGCGRNTFYEHFDDAPAAVQAACAESERTLEEAFAVLSAATGPRTPSGVMMDFAVTWAGWCVADDGGQWALLERYSGHILEHRLHLGVGELHQLLVRIGSAGGVLEDLRAFAICGALRAVARRVHERPADKAKDVARAIADGSCDVLTRLLR
jgi:hypothetical protein